MEEATTEEATAAGLAKSGRRCRMRGTVRTKRSRSDPMGCRPCCRSKMQTECITTVAGIGKGATPFGLGKPATYSAGRNRAQRRPDYVHAAGSRTLPCLCDKQQKAALQKTPKEKRKLTCGTRKGSHVPPYGLSSERDSVYGCENRIRISTVSSLQRKKM